MIYFYPNYIVLTKASSPYAVNLSWKQSCLLIMLKKYNLWMFIVQACKSYWQSQSIRCCLTGDWCALSWEGGCQKSQLKTCLSCKSLHKSAFTGTYLLYFPLFDHWKDLNQRVLVDFDRTCLKDKDLLKLTETELKKAMLFCVGYLTVIRLVGIMN